MKNFLLHLTRKLKTVPVASAISWSMVEEGVSKTTGLFATLVFALLLDPENFGLMASIAVFIALSRFLIDGGFGDAIKSAKRRSVNRLFLVSFGSILL